MANYIEKSMKAYMMESKHTPTSLAIDLDLYTDNKDGDSVPYRQKVRYWADGDFNIRLYEDGSYQVLMPEKIIAEG